MILAVPPPNEEPNCSFLEVRRNSSPAAEQRSLGRQVADEDRRPRVV